MSRPALLASLATFVGSASGFAQEGLGGLTPLAPKEKQTVRAPVDQARGQIANPEALNKVWEPDEPLYIAGQPISRESATELRAWLKARNTVDGTNWFVVLTDSSDHAVTQVDADQVFTGFRAYTKEIKALVESQPFLELKHPKTGEPNGALIFLATGKDGGDRVLYLWAGNHYDRLDAGETSSTYKNHGWPEATRTIKGGGEITEALKELIRGLDAKADENLAAEITKEPINWPLWGGVAAGALAITGLFFWALKRTASQSGRRAGGYAGDGGSDGTFFFFGNSGGGGDYSGGGGGDCGGGCDGGGGGGF
jgi:hypothetical protein